MFTLKSANISCLINKQIAPNAELGTHKDLPNAVLVAKTVTKQNSESGNAVASTVVDNVSSFLNGIRASFRQENVNVSANIQPIASNTHHYGK